MQISLNIKNEDVLEKLLWVLEHFKNDGVEIIKHQKEVSTKSQTYLELEKLNKIIKDDEFLVFKLRNLSENYTYVTKESDDELLYKALKEKHGA